MIFFFWSTDNNIVENSKKDGIINEDEDKEVWEMEDRAKIMNNKSGEFDTQKCNQTQKFIYLQIGKRNPLQKWTHQPISISKLMEREPSEWFGLFGKDVRSRKCVHTLNYY